MVIVNPENNQITLTRGDTMRVKVGIKRDDEEYIPVEGDTVRFTMKHNTFTGDSYKEYSDESPLIEKNVPIDTLILELTPSETKPLGFGMYAYNVELIEEDGTTSTFIKSKIKLTEETDD